MKRYFLLLALILVWGFADAREIRNLNERWRFSLSDDSAAARPAFDDSRWRVLDLPHDWSFEGGYSSDGAQGERGGYTGGGVGWYRKGFSLTAEALKEKVVYLDFDAVYMNSEVWINGHYLGKRPYGYISFGYDVTPYLRPGENIVSVRVDNSLEPSARWYHGCGIYGNVYLRMVSPEHFLQWGTFVTTPEITASKAVVAVCSEMVNGSGDTRVEFEVLDGRGKRIASANAAPADGKASVRMNVTDPLLWSPESPNLYTLRVRALRAGRVVDELSERFGIRSTEWRAETGFWLNGKNVKLNGVCEHLEGGPLGAAWNEKMMRWKLQLLKDMGCNAIRTAHNPQLPMFYDLCDEMGILVMDEAFDGWRKKADQDYGLQAFDRWWERDLRDMVRRDRNHPCVVIYSVGNETKGAVAADLVRVCHEEDSTRAVTSGHSASELMDVLGVNGHSEKQSFLNSYVPGKQAFIGTETPHTWQVRDFYRTQTWYRDGYPNKSQDPFVTPNLTPGEIFGYDWTAPENRANGKQVFNSSYDNGFVRINARQNLEFLRDKPWYSGHFRWTGFDYLGEAGYVHGGWPFRAFMGGVIDMAGFPKDHYFLYQSQWRPDTVMLHVLPHWTHPCMESGTEIPVWAYTTADEVELFLNGESQGSRTRGSSWDKMQCEWLVGWTPGVLEAVARKGGKEVARTVVKTSRAPSRLVMASDTRTLKSGPDDMAIITITQTDAEGTRYPYGENRVWFAHPESVVVRSAESGNPVDTETNYEAVSKRPFFGLLRVFVQAEGDQKDLSFVAGVICGDKALKLSPLVSIDVREVALRGKLPRRAFKIRYTVDGSQPDVNSPVYLAPFPVGPGVTVRAAVWEGTMKILDMQEKFGSGEGLYWGKPGEEAVFDNRMQAEGGTLKNAEIGKDETATFVRLGEGGSVEWYQENDGSEHKALLTIRYRMPGKGKDAALEVLNNDRRMTLVEFPDTGDVEWREKKVDVVLRGGANALKLRIISGSPAPEIDFVIVGY